MATWWGLEGLGNSGPVLQEVVLYQESPQGRESLGILWRLKGRRFAREARTHSKEKGASQKAPPLNHQFSLPIIPRPEFSLWGTWILSIFLWPLLAGREEQLAGWSLTGPLKLCLYTQGSRILHFLQGYEQGQRQGLSEVGHTYHPHHVQGPGGLLLTTVTQIGLMHMTKETLSANPGTWGPCHWHQPSWLILLLDSNSEGPSEILPSSLAMDPTPQLTTPHSWRPWRPGTSNSVK